MTDEAKFLTGPTLDTDRGTDVMGGRGKKEPAPTVTSTIFDLLRIGIASPDDIRSKAWSRGEVKKPEPLTTALSSPNATDCSASASSGRPKTSNARAANSKNRSSKA